MNDLNQFRVGEEFEIKQNIRSRRHASTRKAYETIDPSSDAESAPKPKSLHKRKKYTKDYNGATPKTFEDGT